MTTPGEGLPDEQKPIDASAPNKGVITDEEFKKIPRSGHYGWVDPVFKFGLAALGIGGLGAGAYAIYEGMNQHSSAKQPAKSAPESPYPNTTFMTNVDLANLPFVTDKAGPVPDQGFNFRTLRADEVDSSAVCKTADPNKYVSESVKTIVIYRSDAPKEGFKQVWPSIGEQTALANITLFSHEFANKFKDGGRIGTPKAERLATEVKQDLCVEEGTFVDYKDQHIRQVLPESQGLFGDVEVTPKMVAALAILGFIALEFAIVAGTTAKDEELRQMCSRALSSQGKLFLKIPDKLRARGEKDNGDDETITWPADSPEAMAVEVKPESHQEWGVEGDD